jgi:hypothetical protein
MGAQNLIGDWIPLGGALLSLGLVDPGKEETWHSRPFLTVDMDWAHDDVIWDCLTLIDSYAMPSTWFVTHQTDVLGDMRRRPKVELGIHPNFRPFFEGTSTVVRAEDEVDRLVSIVPKTRVVRSHSVVSSSHLSGIFGEKGITHESNTFIPYGSGIFLEPWPNPQGLIQIPFGWADDVATYSDQPEPSDILASSQPLQVFDFHPIHVFLNTESMDRYERTRDLHHDPKRLLEERFEGYGTRSRLNALLREMVGSESSQRGSPLGS